MKVLVTGGAGFLGRYVVDFFERNGDEVFSVDRIMQGGPRKFRVNLTSKDRVEAVFQAAKPDAVIHLAAVAGSTGTGGGVESLKDPYYYFKNNFLTTLNIFETCREVGVKYVIVMSSFSPYGKAPCPITEETPLDPNNPYGGSKQAVESVAKTYARCFGIKTMIFRAPLLSGERQMEMNALRQFVSAALNGEPLIVWGDGSTLREFVHPLDVARAYQKGLDYLQFMDQPYDTFVLGNEPISMKDLASMIVKIVGKGAVKLLKEKPRLFDQFTDRHKISSVLGWVPAITVEEIVRRVVKDMSS